MPVVKMGIIKEAKYLVFLNFNIIITFYSTVLLAFGIVLQIDETKGIRSNSHLYIGAFSIATGLLDLLMASIGLWITAKKKSSLLNYFMFVLLLIFALQVVLGAISLGPFDADQVKETMNQIFIQYGNQTLETVDKIQRNFQCCGITGPKWWKLYDKDLPYSCCLEESQPCQKPFDRGCVEKYVTVIERNLAIIGGIALGFAPIMLATMVLAWYIRLTSKDKI